MCGFLLCVFFFFKQKTAYEMRISDWSSDVCSSDLQCVTCMIARCVTGEVYRRACKVVRRARTAQWRLESDSGSYFRAHFGIGLRHFRNDEARRDDVGPDAITPKLRRQRF